MGTNASSPIAAGRRVWYAAPPRDGISLVSFGGDRSLHGGNGPAEANITITFANTVRKSNPLLEKILLCWIAVMVSENPLQREQGKCLVIY